MGNSWNKIINDLSNDPQSQLFTKISNLPDTIGEPNEFEKELYKIIMTVPQSYDGVIEAATNSARQVKSRFDSIDLLQKQDNQLITDIKNLKTDGIDLNSSHLDYFIQKLKKYIDDVNRKITDNDKKNKYLEALDKRVALISNLKTTIGDEILGQPQGSEDTLIYNQLRTNITTVNNTPTQSTVDQSTYNTLVGGGSYSQHKAYKGNGNHTRRYKGNNRLKIEY
jgi:hypothetical protein